jgi:hypothetical protein
MFPHLPQRPTDWIFALSVTIIFYDVNINNELVGYTAGLNFFFAQVCIIF